MKKLKLSLGIQILISLVLAIIFGLLLTKNCEFAKSYIKPFGTIFINLIKWIVCPIVLFSIMNGIINLKDAKKVGTIGIATIVYYLCTTACAVAIGLGVGYLFKGFFPLISTEGASYSVSETKFMDTFVNMFPSNFLKPFVDANMLQIIVMAVILGFAIVLLKDKVEGADKAIEKLDHIFVKAMEMILKLSPIGVFCLLTPVIAENGPNIIGSLAIVLLAAYIGYVIQLFGVYSLTLSTLGKMNPIKFFKGLASTMVFAFSSASSVGTLPMNMEATKKLGADEDVTSFVLPLGATINMDGTAIYMGVCSIFIASCWGIELTFVDVLSIILTATIASIGTAGVPGAGMVMLAMVLQSVSIPVAGIALVAGVDRIFDMGRTVVNITGDSSCAIIVSRLKNKSKE